MEIVVKELEEVAPKHPCGMAYCAMGYCPEGYTLLEP